MKYLKPYNESQSFNLDEIRYIANDALIDLIQADMDISVFDINIGVASFGKQRKGIRVAIRNKTKHWLPFEKDFLFNDIKDSVNTLISVFDSEGLKLHHCRYRVLSVVGKDDYTNRWYVDPIEGEIIKLNNATDGKINRFILDFELTDQSIKSYESFSSDSDLWYSNQHKPDYNLEECEDIIKDRLVELDDNGLNVKVKYNYNSISIRIEKPQRRFLVKEALEDVISLISHMSTEWDLEVSIKFDPNNSYNKINKIMKLNYGYDGEGYVDQLRYLSTNYVNGIELNFHKKGKLGRS